jgi:hypothetical protein
MVSTRQTQQQRHSWADEYDNRQQQVFIRQLRMLVSCFYTCRACRLHRAVCAIEAHFSALSTLKPSVTCVFGLSSSRQAVMSCHARCAGVQNSAAAAAAHTMPLLHCYVQYQRSLRMRSVVQTPEVAAMQRLQQDPSPSLGMGLPRGWGPAAAQAAAAAPAAVTQGAAVGTEDPCPTQTTGQLAGAAAAAAVAVLTDNGAAQAAAVTVTVAAAAPAPAAAARPIWQQEDDSDDEPPGTAKLHACRHSLLLHQLQSDCCTSGMRAC